MTLSSPMMATQKHHCGWTIPRYNYGPSCEKCFFCGEPLSLPFPWSVSAPKAQRPRDPNEGVEP
jgi:hypothetical protein